MPSMEPYLADADFTLYVGDVRQVLATLPDGSVDCVVTSPPYWGLRDYGTGSWEGGNPDCDHRMPSRVDQERAVASFTLGGSKDSQGHLKEPSYRDVCGKCGARRQDQQLGLEPTPDQYVQNMVAVFREVRRVLADHGTCWVNLGDSYAASQGRRSWELNARDGHADNVGTIGRLPAGDSGLKPKDLVGIPWKVSQALQAPYYAGKISDERDRVWLAATIDAEGTICGFRHERKDDGRIRTGVHVTITNSNSALLDNAQRIWPTTRLDHNAHGDGHLGGLPTWRWIAHNVDSKALLMRELYPHLIAKRKQAALAYNLLEMSRVAKRSARTAQADEIRGRRDWIVDALSRLNHAQDVDVPSWCVEPPTLYEPGWYLRSDIVWSKANPMPESVTDRPTKAHEYVFLLSKKPRYYFDAEAVREPQKDFERGANGTRVGSGPDERPEPGVRTGTFHPDRGGKREYNPAGRNVRSVWEIATQPYPEAHFATYPEELVRRCLLAGCPERVCRTCGKPSERLTSIEYENPGNRSNNGRRDGSFQDDVRVMSGGRRLEKRVTTEGWSDCGHNNYRPGVVLDPFLGSGTTAVVARRHGRHTIGIELNPAYAELAAKRTRQLSLLA